MTFPGRFYFLNAERDWPGDVESADGSAPHTALDP